jgi:hypothetical protein
VIKAQKRKEKEVKTMKKGFYIRAYGYDCFIETDAKNRTKTLATEFINGIQNMLDETDNIDKTDAINEKTIEYVKNNMLSAYCELKTLPNGREYFDIYGENFGGYGYFVDEDKTIIITL